MNNWYIDQKIICIDAVPNSMGVQWKESFKFPLEDKKIYVIRDIIKTNKNTLGIRVNEIVCYSSLTKEEYLWDSRRFRPLKDKDVDISVFYSILQSVNNSVKNTIMEEI